MNRTDVNLDSVIDHTVGEITRTDTKASLLLALDGILLAGVASLGSAIPTAALVASAVSVAATAAAILTGLMVVRPHLRVRGHEADRSSFVWLATATPEEITAAMTADRRVGRVQVLSRITLRKMRWLTFSTDATAVAVIALAAAALITVA